MSTTARERFLQNLAAAFLAGEWTAAKLRASARAATGLRLVWVTKLARQLLTAHPTPPPFDVLLTFLEHDAGTNRACDAMARSRDLDGQFPMRRVFVRPSVMSPPPAALGAITLPPLTTDAALAEWLGITCGRLRWFADITGRNRHHPPGPLRTYRHRWVAKRSGGWRLLEVPRGGLKRLQRKVLDGILHHIPPHPAAHGFRPTRSIVTNAAPHCGKQVVLKFDLADFFPTVAAARVVRLFRTVGYPETVARLLAGLCTTRLPRDVWAARPGALRDGSDHTTWQRLASRHLPQGAPTSPSVANLTAFRLDRRLARLASAVGADYTRYADDLTFSGGEELARRTRRFAALVAVIAVEEGFALNYRKTRVMGRSVRQQVAGVVVNTRPNVPRADFDRIKATLTNCARNGPANQNRDARPDFRAYLSGKVAHVAAVNPARGRKLWAIFDKIVWGGTAR